MTDVNRHMKSFFEENLIEHDSGWIPSQMIGRLYDFFLQKNIVLKHTDDGIDLVTSWL